MAVYAMTGGATGIGAAIKHKLMGEGHEIIVIDIKDADIEADLSTTSGRSLAVDSIINKASSGLDGLICCAGVGSHIPNKALIASVNYYGSIELVMISELRRTSGACPASVSSVVMGTASIDGIVSIRAKRLAPPMSVSYLPAARGRSSPRRTGCVRFPSRFAAGCRAGT